MSAQKAMQDSLNVVYLHSELRSSQVINLNKAFFITCLVLEYLPTVLPGLVFEGPAVGLDYLPHS